LEFGEAVFRCGAGWGGGAAVELAGELADASALAGAALPPRMTM